MTARTSSTGYAHGNSDPLRKMDDAYKRYRRNIHEMERNERKAGDGGRGLCLNSDSVINGIGERF